MSLGFLKETYSANLYKVQRETLMVTRLFKRREYIYPRPIY
jgi:hypothetical protein